MPYRPLVLALSTVAAVGVLVPFVGQASAASCPTFSDPAADGRLYLEDGTPTLDSDPSLEITRVSVGVADGALTFRTTVAKLAARPAKHTGDDFGTVFTLGGKAVDTYAFRYDPAAIGTVHDVPYNNTGLYVDGAYKSATPVTATYDLATSTVTVSIKLTDLAAAGVPTGGPVTEIATYANAAVSRLSFPYDTAEGGPLSVSSATSCTFGGGGGTPGPTATPSATSSPTPTPSATASPTPTPTATGGPGLPEGYPAAGCNTFPDAKGDGTPDVPVSNGGAPVAELPNDPDLDIVGAALGTTATEFVGFVRVDDLKALPARGNGHWFEVAFTHNAKTLSMYAMQVDQVAGAARTALGNAPGGVIPLTGGRVGTTYNANLKVTSTFDVDNNVVILRMTRESLDAVAGAAAPDGTALTTVAANSRMITPTGGSVLADNAQDADPANRTYTMGNSPCFGPPAGVLTNRGAVRAQFTDAAPVSAALALPDGTPLAGKSVRFSIGSAAVTATTGANGVATALLDPKAAAGAYTLVASFAGDSSAKAATVSTPFTVVPEVTKLVLTVKKSGTKRTVTATLRDDDGKAVPGQVVTWYVNGRKVSAPRTSVAGVVTLTTAKPTQTVKAVFTAVSGKYAGATAQSRV